jgi:type II secretory pathway component PulM
MSKLSERARDFWDRISPRERKLVLLLGVAAPIAVALWLGLAIYDGLSAMERRNDDMREALVIVADLKSRGPQTPKDRTVEDMPDTAVSLETYLSNAATKAGVPWKGSTPHTPVTKNGYVTSSVTCQLDDVELEKVKAFLQEVETTSKYVAVTSIDLKRDRDPAKVDVKLGVSTYSKEKKKPKAGDKPAKDDDKTGDAAADKKG